MYEITLSKLLLCLIAEKSLKLKKLIEITRDIYLSTYEIKQYFTKALQRTYPFYMFCIREMLDIVLAILVLCFICFNFMNVRLMMTV
jgi:hypothetical protein